MKPFKFFARKKGDEAGSKAITPQSFVDLALDFERSKTEEMRKSRNVAWKVAGAAVVVAVLSTASAAIAHWKRPEQAPTIITLNKDTGVSSVMRSVADAQDHFDEIVDKHWLCEYVRFREGYDWFEIGTAFDVVKLMTSADIVASYEKDVSASTSPLKVLKDNGKIRIKGCSVSFVGEMAQVRYTSEKLNGSGVNLDGSPVLNWIATVRYTYDVSRKMTEQQRQVNPMGFQVISYRTDAEVSR